MTRDLSQDANRHNPRQACQPKELPQMLARNAQKHVEDLHPTLVASGLASQLCSAAVHHETLHLSRSSQAHRLCCASPVPPLGTALGITQYTSVPSAVILSTEAVSARRYGGLHQQKRE